MEGGPDAMAAPPPGGAVSGDQRAVKRFRVDDSFSPLLPHNEEAPPGQTNEETTAAVMDLGPTEQQPQLAMPLQIPVSMLMDGNDQRRDGQAQGEGAGNYMPTLQLPPAAVMPEGGQPVSTVIDQGHSDSPLRFEHLSPFLEAAPEAVGGHENGSNQASPQHCPVPAPSSLDQHPFAFEDRPFVDAGTIAAQMNAEGSALTRRTASMDESLDLHRIAAGTAVVSVRKSSFSFASHRSTKSMLVREDKHGAYLGDAGDMDDGGSGYVDDGFDWEEARQAIGTASPQKAPVSFSASIGGVNSAFDRSFDEVAGMVASGMPHHQHHPYQQQEQPQQQQHASFRLPPPVSLSPQRQAPGGSACSADGGGFSSLPTSFPIPPPPTSSPPRSPLPVPTSGAQQSSYEEEASTVWERIGTDFQAVLPDLIVTSRGGEMMDEQQRMKEHGSQQQNGQGSDDDNDNDSDNNDEEEEGISHLSTASSVSSSDHTVLRRQHQQERQATLVWSPGWGDGTLERVVAVTGGGRAAALNRWSVDEVARFDQGLRWYRKNFHIIQRKYLPTKSVKEIVARFYDEHKRSPVYRAWKEDKLIGRRILLRQKRPMWKGGGWEEIKGTIRSCERDEEDDELMNVAYDDGRVGRLYRYEAEVLLLGPDDEPPPPKLQEQAPAVPPTSASTSSVTTEQSVSAATEPAGREG